ncbi:hypothetical protein K2X85_06470 [bacterium]|nr:hypothetical protein [bacterium]
MSDTRATTESAGWGVFARAIASVMIVFHLTALLGLVLAVRTGPWVIPDGAGEAHAPLFASRISDWTESYRDALQLVENYRFPTNARPEAAHRVEILMKDADGKELPKVTLPSEKTMLPAWHRQLLLTDVVAQYQALAPPEGEKIPPPGQAVPTVAYWKRSEDGTYAELARVAEHLLPRNEDLVAPTDYALTAVRSLTRYAKKKYGADKVQVVLVSRPTFGAVTLMPNFAQSFQADDFDAVEFRFGDSP